MPFPENVLMIGETLVNVDSVRPGAPLRLAFRGVEIEMRRVCDDDRAWSAFALWNDHSVKWTVPIVASWSASHGAWVVLDSTALACGRPLTEARALGGHALENRHRQ
jgi:hypothetical protein